MVVYKYPPQGDIGEDIMEKHQHTKAVLNRMSRSIGHLQAVKKMIEDGRDCSEVVVQLSAVRAEIVNVSKVILKDHFDHCIIQAVKDGDENSLEGLKQAIDKLI